LASNCTIFYITDSLISHSLDNNALLSVTCRLIFNVNYVQNAKITTKFMQHHNKFHVIVALQNFIRCNTGKNCHFYVS